MSASAEAASDCPATVPRGTFHPEFPEGTPLIDSIWKAMCIHNYKRNRDPDGTTRMMMHKTKDIIVYVDTDNLPHRSDDKPAIICKNFDCFWFTHGDCTKIQSKTDDDGNYIVMPELIKVLLSTTLQINGETVHLVPAEPMGPD